MSFIQNLFTSRDNNSNSSAYVGQKDRLWWDPVTNRFYYSDGETPGGIPVNSGNSGNTNSISNGNTSVAIPTENGNVTVNISGTANAVVFSAGNTVFAGNLIPTANVTYSLGSNTQRWANLFLDGNTIVLGQQTITSNSTGVGVTGNIVATSAGVFYGESTGNSAVYAGIPGFTELGSNVVAQFSGNANSYSQVNFQNINTGAGASTDYIATADNGNDSTYYVDLGIGSSNHADAGFFGDTSSRNDAYLYVVGPGNYTGSSNVGNLILGSADGTIKMFVGNTAQANVVQTISRTGITVAGNVVPGGNTYSLGTAGAPWKSLYVSGNTIYIDNNAMSANTGNLYWNGQQVISANANGAITADSVSVTGNVTADYFIGDGSLLTNLPGGTGSDVTIQNQGNTLTTAANTINFTGNGVSSTNAGNVVTVTITGGGDSLPSQTGNAGKILTTNGIAPLWETMPGVFGLVIDGGDAAYASSDFIIDGGAA